MKKLSEIIIYILITILIFPAHVLSLTTSDTGQAKCYNNEKEIACPGSGENFYGQDGSYIIDPASYTKLDLNGDDLPDSAVQWYMVRDNITGLIWEERQANDGTADYTNHHDADNTYTWYDSNPETNGGYSGTSGNETDIEDFINALNSEKYGGYSNWRMPTREELRSIVDYSTYGPAVDTKYFSNTKSSDYWSSSTLASASVGAWEINFSNGSDVLNAKTNSYYVRAVCSEQSVLSKHFINNNDGTVTDTATGLIWHQNGSDASMSWTQALDYCENLFFAGYDDWRMPTVKELLSLADLTKSSPAIDTQYFPGPKTYYWSSTTYTNTPAKQWIAAFDNGFDTDESKIQENYYVRPVRGGQIQLPGNLIIRSPARASFLDADTIVPVTWDTQGISGNVKISISRQGGKNGTFDTISESTQNDGNYNWTVTGPTSHNYMLKIESLDDPSKSTRQGLFTIIIKDTINPSQPSLKSAEPDIKTWSNDNTITIGWNQGQDNESGVAGYSVLWNMSAETIPDNIVDTTETALTSSFLTDGNTHYIHICTIDKSGNKSTPLHIGPFFIDTVTKLTVDEQNICIQEQSIIISGTRENDAKIEIISSINNQVTYPSEKNWKVNFSDISEGKHIVFVKTTDITGNTAEEQVAIQRIVPYSATISKSAKEMTANGSDTIELTIDVKDEQGQQICDGTPINISADFGEITLETETVQNSRIVCHIKAPLEPCIATVKIRYDNAVIAQDSIRVLRNPEMIYKAVIAGGSRGDGQDRDFQVCTDYAFKALNAQGYSEDDIFYLDPDPDRFVYGSMGSNIIDRKTTYENLKYALENWAEDADELIIYMMDHGGDGTFHLNGDEPTLKAADLKKMFDNLQQEKTRSIIFIYEACKSGSFISRLTPLKDNMQRIVITSTDEENDSWLFYEGTLTFSYQFWARVYSGFELNTIFSYAKIMMEDHQQAQVDVNGDGISEEFESKYLSGMIIGDGIKTAGDIPKTPGKCEDQLMMITDRTDAKICAKINKNQDSIVKAFIISPDFSPLNNKIPVTDADVPSIDLKFDRYDGDYGVYEAVYDGFILNGVYKIYVFAGNDDGIFSLPEKIEVEQIGGKPYFQCDINGDAKTDLKDAMIALQIMAGMNTAEMIPENGAVMASDINGDKKAGLEEAIFILQKVGEINH